MWWVKSKLRSEGLTYVPPPLALRKEAHDALEAALQAKSESEARQIIEDINERIREGNRKGVPGPPIMLRPFDVEHIVQEWHKRQTKVTAGELSDPH